jgi:hypothetical protein
MDRVETKPKGARLLFESGCPVRLLNADLVKYENTTTQHNDFGDLGAGSRYR